MSWTAKYDGACEKCGAPVKKGEQVEWHDHDDRTVEHVQCPKQPETCPKCFLQHAGKCPW